MDEQPGDITIMLRAVAEGDSRDTDRLIAVIYDDLKRLAAHHLSRERPGHTLHPTALVHEAYIRLINQRSAQWNDRLHFFAIASRIIRRVLVDHARARGAAKRGGAARPTPLTDDLHPATETDVDILALDEALRDLAAIDERQARIVELRFFGGLTIPEIAAELSLSARTVDRQWQAARAWLYRQLADTALEPSDAGEP